MKTIDIRSRKPQGSQSSVLAGDRFGPLTAVRFVGFVGHSSAWEYLCRCGRKVVKRASTVTYRKPKGCGAGCGLGKPKQQQGPRVGFSVQVDSVIAWLVRNGMPPVKAIADVRKMTRQRVRQLYQEQAAKC